MKHDGKYDETHTLSKFKKSFELWADITDSARRLSRRDRAYYNGAQWTDEEVEILKARGQAPIVINRIQPKIDFMSGLERQNRFDPVAYPRTPAHVEAADAITDSLRYVMDNTRFDQISSSCFEDLLIEGVEGAIVEYINKEISISHIPFDRLYWDPHSQHRFFEDATFKGLFIWMNVCDAADEFNMKEDELTQAVISSSHDDSGIDDKPNWVSKDKTRIRVCQHYYKVKGVWHVVYFSGDIILYEPAPSPYLDENGDPYCPIELAYAYQDRELNKYGWTRQFIDLQNEINHRRSKSLYLLSRRSVIMEKGAVDDIYDTKVELSRGDAVVEVNPNKRFEVDTNSELSQGQALLLQEAKQEIDSVANRSMVGGASSGRSRLIADQKDLLEVGPIFDTHRAFKSYLYRQVWARIKQYWDEEKWIRVTDDENNLKFVGLNQPVTFRQVLEERAQQGDPAALEALTVGIQSNDARLDAVVETRNEVAEIDVDITLSEVMDVATVQQEQFEKMVELAQVYGPSAVPFDVVLEMSSLRNKNLIIDRLRGDPQQAAVNQQIQMQQIQLQMERQALEIEKMKVEIAKTIAETDKTRDESELTEQKTIQTALESQVLANTKVEDISGVNVNT